MQFEAMRHAILEGDDALAAELAQVFLDGGGVPLKAVEEGFVVGIREAGRLFEAGEFFLPELVTAAQAMEAAMSVLQPALGRAEQMQPRGRVVIGTVRGDIHDIGKTLVATLLSANGFQVDDLGVDVSVARFVEEAVAFGADLVCASALLSTTMGEQRKLVKAVRESGLKAKILVGGAAVTRGWAQEIGADGFAENAVAAAEAARSALAC